MSYLVPLVLVLLIVGGFVTFMVLNATRKSGPAADGDAEGPPGIGADRTPLGDTAEHADRDSGQNGGHADRVQTPDSAHVARPGEAEGRVRLEFDGEQPAPAAGAARGAHAAPTPARDEPRAAAQPDDDEPAKPASERLADRGV